jgi:MoaA/NifB/PqqE/SkfB family radical SAM enzyme
MNNINSISFALDPGNVPSFLLDWEVTKLCNLDCSYCGTDIDFGGHNNNTKHPPLKECLQSIDFMYKYVDEYMKHKKPTQRKVVLNVYGGESLFHPDIVEILQACRDKYVEYSANWYLTITCTTNGIVGATRWKQVVPLVDEFTVSYHPENLPKQKQLYLDNVLYLKEHNKRFNCVVMMHNDPTMFADAEQVIDFCKQHQLRYVAKPLDNPEEQWAYTKEQFSTLKTFWISKAPVSHQPDYEQAIGCVGQTDQVQSIDEGRPCCGGRKLSLNGDLKSCVSFVPKQGFANWYCSVNWFFLYVQQCTGKVYTNKDCRMNTSGEVGPIGTLDDADAIIKTLQQQFNSNTMPIIQCKKERCYCGFCAPKAENKKDFMDLIKRNVPVDVFCKTC